MDPLRSLVALTLAATAVAQTPDAPALETLDNGVLRVGLSTDHGGALA